MRKSVYAGLFLVSLATLMFEILLTRIFSVTMWYHFAFVAISIAMFGMTVGATGVYLNPAFFTQDRAKQQLAISSFLFSISIVICFLIQLKIPVRGHGLINGFLPVLLTYIIISVPFVFSGICICIALTRFRAYVSKLYAVDLAGAACGCIALICVLKITDAPTAVIVVAFFANLGAFFFSLETSPKVLTKVIFIFCLLFFSLSIINTVLSYKQSPLIRVTLVKSKRENKPLYEKWNPFSRITVWGDQNLPVKPFGWGMSRTYHSDQKIKRLRLSIDSHAGTSITNFDGDLNRLNYLRYDITNLVHYIRSNSKVMVVGTGGGRDILSALVFQQKAVVGIEINEDIINVVNKTYGDFSGHLDKNPKVRFINDEARSYITKEKDSFDIIQVSLIDTWAATAAGAFVLTENSLYTVEAWKIFLEHLTPGGVLSFSRWYVERYPSEVYRLTSLAVASLKKLGIDKPRDHLFIAKCTDKIKRQRNQSPDGTATMLVSREPFSAKDLDALESIARDMQFDVVLSPRVSIDDHFSRLGSGKVGDLTEINLSAPTDDSPFFFNMFRLNNIFDKKLNDKYGTDHNISAVRILGYLLIVVVGLTSLCIILPLILTQKNIPMKGSLSFFIFFMAIGLGFILIEISQMQRLIIFLGHPIYGLSVVLFSLLLSSGLGSYATRTIENPSAGKKSIVFLLILLNLLFVFGFFTPSILNFFQGYATLWRIWIAVTILFPLGFFMGTAFPLGIKAASSRLIPLLPWFWGVNGATSVCASVLAVAISLHFGISATFWTGTCSYLVAFVMFVWKRQANN